MISVDGWGLNFPNICFTVEKKRKKSQSGKLIWPGIEPGPASWMTTMLLLVDLGFTTLLTSQVISVTFYSERKKSDKFFSEALISPWGSFTCRKSTTRGPRPGPARWKTTMSLLVYLGFTTLLTSQVIYVAFYSEREKSENFCSEALISAWVSFTCRKYMTRDPRLYFPCEGSHTQDFYALKKSVDPGRVRAREPRIQWRVW